MMIQQHQLPWGTVLFDLNQEEFRRAFCDGRRYYYEEIHGEYPERATTLTALDVLDCAAYHNERTGQYRFDVEGIDHPVACLGIFLGYATAPFLPETPEEQVRRLDIEARVHDFAMTVPFPVVSQ